MVLPPLLMLGDEAAYRKHWLQNYVDSSPLTTFDGIAVRFFPEAFDHAFFKDSITRSSAKDTFDFERARRMDWIASVLGNSSTELYRRLMSNGKTRRIALVTSKRYAVIIQLGAVRKPARFITAYLVDSESALKNMRANPKWQ